jgi:anti-anti-sigma factor
VLQLRATHSLGDLELDLSALEFLDSSGLAVMLGATMKRRVTLRRPSDLIVCVLDITGVLDKFEIVP